MAEGDCNDDRKSELEPALPDYVAAAAKGLAGAVPIVGGALGEVLAQLVPNQRLDRVTKYISNLEERLKEVEFNLQSLTESAIKLDMVEEGARQSARATNEERIERIAGLVASTLRFSDQQIIRDKRLLKIFGELDDEEVWLLNQLSCLQPPYLPQHEPMAYEIAARERLEASYPEAIYTWRPTEMDKESELKIVGIDNLMRFKLISEWLPPESDIKSETTKGNSSLKLRFLVVTNLGWSILNAINRPKL